VGEEDGAREGRTAVHTTILTINHKKIPMRKIIPALILLALLCACTAKVSRLEANPAQVRWEAYTDPERGYSLNFPKNWSLEHERDRLTITGPNASTVAVQALSKEDYATLDEAVGAVLEQASASENYRQLSGENRTREGERAVEVVIAFNRDGQHMRQDYLFLQEADTIYVIGYLSTIEDYPKTLDAYEMVKGTFRVGP